MFTVSFVLYERTGMSREEALRYWRETHGPIVRQVPGLRRYVQQHAVAAPDGQPPFLGLAWISFDDQETFSTAAAGPEFAAALADLPNFADETKLPTAFVEEYTILG
jgi:uncharacterized protein (TIGR02118 family)